MAFTKRTTVSSSTQQIQTTRSQSNLDWNAPKTTRTPRSEYRFMRNYSALLSAPRPRGPFGPFNGGVAQ